MRIADAVMALPSRPDAVVVGNDAAADLAGRVAEQLGLPLKTQRGDPDRAVVVLVTADREDLAGAVDTAMARTGGMRPADRCLVLVDAGRDGLPAGAVAASAAAHGLELVAVGDVAHPTLSTVLHLVPAEDVDVAAARTELHLEREVSRRARVAATAAAGELDRRGERIDALQAEVDELRERVQTLEVQHERAVGSRDKELVVLQREVGRLEASTSYRTGHALVRLLKDPTLVRRFPARILRWLRS